MCGPSRRHNYTHQERLDLAEDALRLVDEKSNKNGHLTFREQLKLIAGDVKHTGKKTTGEKFQNLYTWTRPAKLEELRGLCQQDPTKLGEDGKHKGGRGNKKAGQKKTSRTVYKGWFEEEEERVDARIDSERQKRVRVSSQDVLEWRRHWSEKRKAVI